MLIFMANKLTNCFLTSLSVHRPRHHLPSSPVKPTCTVQFASSTEESMTKRAEP